jgi:hypothetical protein
MLPFSDACERNKGPILGVLRIRFADRRQVLEIGSGTGQHAVFFAAHLPHLTWPLAGVRQGESLTKTPRESQGVFAARPQPYDDYRATTMSL